MDLNLKDNEPTDQCRIGSAIKITFLVDQMILGGVETVFVNMAAGLAKTKTFKIQLISGLPIQEPYFLKFIHRMEIEYHHLGMRQMPKNSLLRFVFRLARKLVRPITNAKLRRRVSNQDAIIDFKSGFFRRAMHTIHNVPKVLWLHDSVEYTIRNLRFDWRIYDRIVCLTDQALKQFAEHRPEIKDRLIRIYNPIDLATIRQQSLVEPDTTLLQKLSTENFFVIVGRLDEDKDVDTVLRAFSRFCTQSPAKAWHLVIVGDGSQRNRLQKLAESDPFSSRIHFLGAIIPPFFWMRKAKAVILSSFSEGFGLVLLEALAVNTIPISADCPTAPREILQDGQFGFLFPPGDHVELAAVLNKIARGDAEVAAIRKRIAERLKYFHSDIIFEEISGFLQMLVPH